MLFSLRIIIIDFPIKNITVINLEKKKINKPLKKSLNFRCAFTTLRRSMLRKTLPYNEIMDKSTSNGDFKFPLKIDRN